MFGLMRQRGCVKRQRSHYCGTCKTLGARHGWWSRGLLNHDTVFLAELLDALAPPSDAVWHPAYATSSCLRLPSVDGQPLSLRLAAAATVWMTAFKLQDRLEDRGGWHWRGLLWHLRGQFQRARDELQHFGVAVDEIAELLAGQHQREATAGQILHTQGAEQALASVATPTAASTALVLAQGMVLVGRPDLQTQGAALGHRFGTLIYLLDAWEDYREDHRRGDFNALGMVHGYPANLNHDEQHAWRTRLWVLAEQLWQDLAALPLSANIRGRFQARLRLNLTERLEQNDQNPAKRKRRSRERRWSWADGCCDCCTECPSCNNNGGTEGCCGCDGCSCDGCGCDCS